MRTLIFLLVLCFNIEAFALNCTHIGIVDDQPPVNVPRIEDPKPTNVPRLTDPPGTQVPILEDEPRTKVPVLPTDPPRTQVPRVDDPDPSDLLDIEFPDPEQPLVPNAGKEVFKELKMDSRFSFNKKISFIIYSFELPAGLAHGHMYLNTQTGASMMDKEGMSYMMDEMPEGELTQIMTTDGNFYMYTSSPEAGKISMKMGGEVEMVFYDLITDSEARQFFSKFKRVQNDRVHNINSVKYTGTMNGQTMSIWLANSGGIRLDPKYTSALTGYQGLGYILNPTTGRTFLIAGFAAGDYQVFVQSVENVNVRFDGSVYKPIGDVIGGLMGTDMEDFNQTIEQAKQEAIRNADGALSNIQLQQADKMAEIAKTYGSAVDEFRKTSDLGSFGNINHEDASLQMYDLMLLGIEESRIRGNQELQEARRNQNDFEVQRIRCLLECNRREESRIQKTKEEHIAILKRYKDDEDTRDEKVGELMMRSTMEMVPCECN